MEIAIGSRLYLLYFLLAAFVSSAFQLAASDTTGIGASGVVYAIFGFMWPTRTRYPSFAKALDRRTIRLVVVWMGGCVIAEYLQVAEIGNAAHLSGFLFGVAVAYGFVLPFTPIVFRMAAASLIVVGTIPLFWCPWSASWLSTAAYEAHVAEDYEQAISYYSSLVRIDPDNPWAYLNRSYAFQALGQPAKAESDLAQARRIDPDIEDET